MRKRIIVFFCIIILSIILGVVYYFSNYDSYLIDPNKIKTDSKFENIIYDTNESILDENILAILTIEKINLKTPVSEGSDNKTLKEYVGHIENTSLYDGNIGLAGHNRGYKNSYFSRINELEVGDEISYQTKFYTRKFKVNNIQTIFDTDWSLLENTEDNNLTLITCIANKKNQRLCVQAKEIIENIKND